MVGKNKYTGVQLHGGSLRIWFTWQGKRTYEPIHLAPTQNNYKAAARLRQEISQRIKLGAFNYAEYFPESPNAHQTAHKTFGQLANNWISSLADKAPSTRYGYQKMLHRYLLPPWQNKAIKDISYSEITALIGSLKVSAKTRNNILTPIRQIFEIAYIDDHIKTNPASKLKSSKIQKQLPDPFTLEEVEQILNHLQSRYPEPIRNYFQLAFFAGMRTSELIALKWGDIDWNNNLIRVQRAKVLQQIKGTKTYQIREVELNSRAIATLKRQKTHTYLATEWIFLNPNTGQPFIDDRPIRRWSWIPTLKALGMRHRAAYQTRHTCATMMLMAGNNPAWAAKQLGHSIEMFLRTYSKWINLDDKGAELEKFEQKINQNIKNVPTVRHKGEIKS